MNLYNKLTSLVHRVYKLKVYNQRKKIIDDTWKLGKEVTEKELKR